MQQFTSQLNAVFSARLPAADWLPSLPRWLWLIVFTCLVWPLHSAGQAPESEEAAVASGRQLAMAAAVRISNRSGHFLGCGVVVASGELEFQVLTAEHIVRAFPQLIVHSFAPGQGGSLGQRVEHSSVQVLAEDSRADLALLLVKSGIPPAGKLSVRDADQAKQPAPPFPAWVVDWNRSEALQTRSVRVVRRHTARRDAASQPVSFWELAEPSRSGMSGGGLVSESGELIGIASGNSGQHAYYSDETEIAQFLASGKR